MADPEFCHLHVHSEYSLLDGANRIGNLVKACEADQQPAIALTDHGNMFGAIEFYQKCMSGGIKPVVGCEVYIAQHSRKQPHSKKQNRYHHLTLLARNEEGFSNLKKLASLAYTEGYHFRPRIDKEILSQYAGGISCLSGCLGGEVSQLFLRDKEDEAERVTTEFRDLFGADHFWLELQRNGIEIQDKVNESMVRLAQRTGIPLVATNDIHYLRHEDCAAQDVLLCINTGAKRDDEKRFRFDTDSLFFRTRKEMGDMFRDLPQSLKATMDVVEQVGLDIEFGKYHLPIFDTGSEETQEAMFDRLCEEGLARFYDSSNQAARERLEHEKNVIAEMGFTSYFLIVGDLIKWARDHDIPVGPGRGSAAGSIVAYVLEITKVDPLEYDLLFERFLNSARVSMPDIDIDFCKEGRERVLAYTRERYGNENVAQIVTFGTMASRTVVRDVGRVLDVPLKDIDTIAKKIPAGPGAPPLAQALETDPDLKKIREDMPELEDLFQISKELEGMARHISTHAAGVVIADKPIDEYVPLCLNGDDLATQWPAPQLEELGLLKMDYLGLRTLTILDRALANIKKQGNEPPDLDELPAGDPKTYDMLTGGDTLAVFQLESEGMRKLLARLKPDCFEDLIAVLALYRPGPLESGMVDMFVRRKHGEEPIEYPHEALESLLKPTYGCIVYQEQVMLISSVLANFSLNEADNLRKAMGKKKPEILQKFAAQFVEGAVANGCDKKVAEETWANIVKFGGYGFNKSHSTAYAMITYQTAYLKANFRSAFLAANLSCEMGDSDKVKALLDDVKRAEIDLLPPDLRYSDWEFEPEDGAIRFGMGAVKGTGQKAIEALLAARAQLVADDKALGLHSLCGMADPAEVPRLAWEAIIKAGVLDFTEHNRGSTLAALDGALSDGARAAADRRSGQGALFGEPEPAAGGGDDDGIDDTRNSWKKSDALRAEHEVLGFYLSGHPLEERAGLFQMLSSSRTSDLDGIAGGTVINLAGLIVGYSEAIVKSGRMAGRKMARFRIEDLHGSIGVTCFPRTFDEYREHLGDDTVVVCRGKLEENEDEAAMILEEVMTIEDALARFDGGVVILLEPEDRASLPDLKAAIDEYPGTTPVFLQVTGTDGHTRRVRAANQIRVKVCEDLALKVDGLLGQGRVRLARM